jgi:hypothetical protein
MRRLTLALAVVLVVGLILAGCNGGEEEPTASPTEGPGETVTATATMAPTVTEGPATTSPGGGPSPGEVEPVNFNQLIPYLPATPGGWDAEDPDGFTGKFGEWWWSEADREYTNQATDETVDVIIYDSAYYYGFAWFQVYDMAFEIESTDMYMRRTTVDGYPAWDMWYEPDDYSLMVFVVDRFMVMVSAQSEASIDLFSGLINYDGIASLD